MSLIIKSESQNTEFKESWRDEYLKWICGFANARGGKIYIGVNDKGEVTGLPKSKKLMEDIPNKIVNMLGIVADVNLFQDGANEYIEISVTPYNVPISYRGVYHYRSGSTKQELNGTALQQFLLKKMGRSWDDMAYEGVGLDIIDEKAVTYFLNRAIAAQRMPASSLDDSVETVLDNLNLIDSEHKLKNAAILLFAKRPEHYFPSVQFKIGRFGKDDTDLIFAELKTSWLLNEKVIDLL
jgi:ATP-dependent DNA helicase RecG